jgi:restriction system protein
MAIPDYQSLMLPLLRLLEDGQEHTVREAIDKLANEFDLTEEERKALLPSGRQTVFRNRVSWASTYLNKAGVIESPRRGHMRITDRGKEVLKQNPQKIDAEFLSQFEEFVAFRAIRSQSDLPDRPIVRTADETPEELLVRGYSSLKENVISELLEQVMNASPEFFERLVVELLVKMGYGGSYREAATVVGRSGDEGIDGVIKEDRLGLDVIYIQAKRWTTSVGIREVREFAGAIQDKRARKGIIITTSNFTRDAREFASRADCKIVLIDGQQLAELMFEYGVGVSTVAVYEVKKVDYDFFAEE